MGLIADAPTIFDRGDPGPTPALGAIPLNNFVTMTYDNTAGWVTDGSDNVMLVYSNIPRGSGVNFFRRRSRLAGTIYSQDATGSFNFLNQWLPQISYGQKWAAWWAIAYNDGRLTRWAPIPPFDTGPAPVPAWIEEFPYPDGPLAGNGGWADIVGPDTPWSVLSDQAHVSPNTTAGAIVTPTPTPPDYVTPWTASATFTVDPGIADTPALGFNFGDLATQWLAVNLNWDRGSDGADILHDAGAQNTGGGPSISSGTLALTSAIPHVLNIAWDGANLTLKIDGVTVATGPVDTTAAAADFLLTATSNDNTTTFDVERVTIQSL